MNRIPTALLLLVLSTALASASAFAEGFSSVEEQMTGKEFTAAGLDKLSPAELEALNEWIRGRSLATLDTPKAVSSTAATASSGDDQRGFEDRRSEGDRSPITSTVVGSFTGWDGNTVFELANGMIWEQADKDKFYIREVQNPTVIIEPGAFGTWRLHVDGYAKECRVERIQ